jgi:hypothetical protein
MSLFISYNREQKDFADKIESSVRSVCPILRDTNDIAPWGNMLLITLFDRILLTIGGRQRQSIAPA